MTSLCGTIPFSAPHTDTSALPNCPSPPPPSPPPPFPPYYHARAAFLSNTQNGGITACLFQQPGQTLCSPNGAWCLVFQSTDANLVMYKTGGGAVWGINTIPEPTCAFAADRPLGWPFTAC